MLNSFKKSLLILLIILLISVPSMVWAVAFIDSDSTDFSAATKINVVYDLVNDWLDLFNLVGKTEFQDNGATGDLVNMDGNVGLWHFDESSWNGTSLEVIDSSSANNHGTASNATVSGSGRLGNAGSFNGSSAEITFSRANNLHLSEDATVMFWINPSSTAAAQNVVIFSDAGETEATNVQYLLGIQTGGDIELLHEYGAGLNEGYVSDANIPTGQWTHVAMTRDESAKQYDIYINGDFFDSFVYTNSPSGGTSAYLNICRFPTFSGYCDGLVDEIGIWNRVLTADQINTVYNAQSVGLQNELPDSAVTNEWFDMTNNVALWHMDEVSWNGTTDEVIDSSGNSNDGTASDNATTTTGLIGSAGTFDATGDNVIIPDSASLDITGDITLTAWIKPASNSSDQGIIYKDSDTNSRSWGLALNGTTDGITGAIFTSDVSFCTLDGSTAIPLNEWTHVAMTYDYVGNGTSLMDVYVNGVKDATQVTNCVGPIQAGNSSVQIGSREYSSSRLFFDGEIDEAAIFTRTLSASDIRHLYNRQRTGTPTELPANSGNSQWVNMTDNVALYHLDESSGTIADSSGNGNDGTLSGALYSYSGKLDNAIFFDGSDDYIQISNHASLNPDQITVSAWISPDSLSGDQKIISTTESGGWQMAVDGGLCSGEICFVINDGSYYAAGYAISNFNNNWHLVTGTYDGETLRFYVDGIEVDSNTTPSGAIQYPTPTPICIASEPSASACNQGAYNYAGLVDELAIWNRPLSGGEIANIYARQAPAHPAELPDKAATDWWFDMTNNQFLAHFDEASYSGLVGEALDDSGNQNHGTATADATTTTGKIGNAATFDGAGDRISYGDPANGSLDYDGTTSLTWMYWFKSSAANSGTRAISKGHWGYSKGIMSRNSSTSVHWAISAGSVDNSFEVATNGVGYLDGDWHHAALVYDIDADTVQIFVDGVAQTLNKTASACGTVNDTVLDTSACPVLDAQTSDVFSIGSASNGTENWTGQIDEFVSIKRALTAGEIDQIYQQQGSITSNNLPDNGSTDPWFDTTGNILTLHMDDESGSIVDTSGNGFDATVNGDVAYGANGKLGDALTFDGSGDYLNIGDQVELEVQDGMTASLWMKTTSTTPGELLSKGGSTWEYVLHQDASDEIAFTTTQCSGNAYLTATTSGYSISDGNWHHVLVTADTSELNIYIDGQLAATDNTTSGTLCAGGGDPVRIGFPTWGSRSYYNGDLDELLMFERVLSAAEVQALYSAQYADYHGIYTSQIYDGSTVQNWENIAWEPLHPYGKPLPDNGGVETVYSSGNIDMTNNQLLAHFDETGMIDGASVTDSSSNTNNGTLSTSDGSTEKSNLGQFNNAINFDGSNDYISFGDQADFEIGTNISLSAWAKLDAHNTNGSVNYSSILNKDTGWFNGYRLSVRPNQTLAFGTGDSGATSLYSSSTIDLGKWFHVAATYDGATKKIYVNGVLDATTSKAGSINYSTGSLEIGRGDPTGPNDYYFNGSIDEVAIFDDVLSDAEVLAMYRRGANRLKYQVRSCDDSACSGESFAGPDGTLNTYYSEADNNSIYFPNLSLSNVPANQYIQYRTFYESDASDFFPELRGTSINSQAGSSPSVDVSTVNASPVLISAPSDGGSAISNPANVGDSLTFTATAHDVNSDQYYLAVCATDVINVGNDTAPTCDSGQEWAISSATNSDAQASAIYTPQSGDADSEEWYAFVCDKLPTANSPSCHPTIGSPGGNKGRAVGTLTFSEEPAEEDDFTIDSVQYRIDAAGNGCVGAGTCIDLSEAANAKQAADIIAAAETGASSYMAARANVIYVYATTEGTAGSSIAMSIGTCSVCSLSGATLFGGSDDNASPFYVNHAGTFGSAYIGENSGQASITYPDINGLSLTSVVSGVQGNGIQLVVVDDNTTNCEAALPANLAAHISVSGLVITLTCDIDISIVGSDIVDGTRLAAAINHASDPTGGLVTASVPGTGNSQITATSGIKLTNVQPGDLLTFTIPAASISDSDVSGGQDTMQMHICPSGNASFDYDNNLCDLGSAPICSSSAIDPTSQDLTCTESSAALTNDAAGGVYDVEIYVEDGHDLAAIGTSTQNYTVVSTPQLIFYSAADSPAPGAGLSDTVDFTVYLEDADGENDITNVRGVFFDPSSSGVGNSGEGTHDCNPHEKNCYEDTSCTITTAYGNSNQIQADCSVTVWFNANASDWDVQVEVTDTTGTFEMSDANVALTNPPLLGVDVVETVIDYGVLEIGKTSSGQETSIGNAGNQVLDLFVGGDAMTCSDNANCIANPIGVAQQKFHHTSNNFIWSDAPSAPGPYALTANGSGTDDETGCLNRDIAVRSDHASEVETNESIFWQLKLSNDQPVGTYTGTNNILGTLSGTCSSAQSY